MISLGRGTDMHSRSKSIGFFEKILSTENGDIRNGVTDGNVVITSTVSGSANNDPSIQAAMFVNGGTARRVGMTSGDVNQLQIDFRILQQKRQIAEMTR